MIILKCFFAFTRSAPKQAKINHEILNSKVFNLENQAYYGGHLKKPQRGTNAGATRNRYKSSASAKARSKMNIHNNEAGRRVWIAQKQNCQTNANDFNSPCSLKHRQW